MGTAAAAHLPVMRDRVAELLAPALELPGAVLVDATLGRAGHASALLAAHPGLSLIGIDTDATAIDESSTVLAAFAGRVTLVQAVYDELPEILARTGHAGVQGILFDLGVSSPQLDDPGRGFAYSRDAPLDMRMNQADGLTAADVLNTYPADQLARVLRDYGEERFARRIADAVVRRAGDADRSPALPARGARPRGHPGARPADRGQPGQAHLPGAADRGQRGARRAAPGTASGARRSGGRRPDRCPRLPLARGPRGQAGARGAVG